MVEQRENERLWTSRFLQGIVLLLQVHHARPGIHHVRQRRVRRPGLRPRLLRSTPIPAFLAHASGTAGPLHSSATHCAICDLPFLEAWVGACACACANGHLEGQTPCSTRVGCDETRDRARPLTARLHGCPSWMQVSRRGCPAPPRRFDPVLAMQTLYTPPIGWRNNTDGGRSILFPDYRQA